MKLTILISLLGLFCVSAYAQQDSACWYLKIDQIYDSVRNEPRFQALVEKIFHETQ